MRESKMVLWTVGFLRLQIASCWQTIVAHPKILTKGNDHEAAFSRLYCKLKVTRITL